MIPAAILIALIVLQLAASAIRKHQQRRKWRR